MNTCTNCHIPLTRVFPDSKSTIQFNDALAFDLIGGYGMYFDRLEEVWGVPRLPTVIFCSTCADKLFETFPSLRTVIAEDE